jgi:thioesterase domain-containing protein
MTIVAYVPRVIIQYGSSAVPAVICIPGSGASVTSFCDFAEALGSDIPVHGLQARGFEGVASPFPDVESAAACYLEALHELSQPGLYHLVGHSFGGWIALEMALRLRRLGTDVGTLLILDSRLPANPETQRTRTRAQNLVQLVSLLEQHVGRTLSLTAADFEPLGAQAQLNLLLERLSRVGVFSTRSGRRAVEGIVSVFEANASTRYIPSGVFDGSLCFVSARIETTSTDPTEDQDVLRRGWASLSSHVVFGASAGNHVRMLSKPHIEPIARWVRRRVLTTRQKVDPEACPPLAGGMNCEIGS